MELSISQDLHAMAVIRGDTVIGLVPKTVAMHMHYKTNFEINTDKL